MAAPTVCAGTSPMLLDDVVRVTAGGKAGPAAMAATFVSSAVAGLGAGWFNSALMAAVL